MGHSPNENHEKLKEIQPRWLSSGIAISLLTTRTSSICSHQSNWWSSQERRTTYKTTTQQQGKLEPTTFISYSQISIFTIQYPYNIQACFDFPINTLRLDSTHPDTYNLVGFSGCWHLWWIPLLTPELCVTSVIMNHFSLTTRLTLNECWASCYSHHMSQSALGETSWFLRVLGCNLTLNPYLVIQMGHHHGHPLTGAMGLHPDHWSTTLKVSPRDSKELCTDTDQPCSRSQRIFTMQTYINRTNF